jgi:NADPH-ferrihemoprotein reductase
MQLVAWALIIVGGAIYIIPYLPRLKLRTNRKRVNKIICKSMLPPIRVYYGSQTGTSEGFAKTLVDECNSNGIAAKLVDMNDFIGDEFAKEKISILLLSSYGKGGPTTNAKKFNNWLEKSKLDLSDLKIGLFGCGDASFNKFNGMAKKAFEKLITLKAKIICDPVYGNASGNMEKEFAQWKESVLQYLKKNVTAGAAVTEAKDVFTIESAPNDKYKPKLSLVGSQNINSEKLPIKSMVQIRQSTEETSTYYMTIDSSKAKFAYKTAQNLAIFCPNDKSVVAKALAVLNIKDPKQYIVAKCESDEPYAIPAQLTIKKVLKNFCDLTGKPK